MRTRLTRPLGTDAADRNPAGSDVKRQGTLEAMRASRSPPSASTREYTSSTGSPMRLRVHALASAWTRRPSSSQRACQQPSRSWWTERSSARATNRAFCLIHVRCRPGSVRRSQAFEHGALETPGPRSPRARRASPAGTRPAGSGRRAEASRATARRAPPTGEAGHPAPPRRGRRKRQTAADRSRTAGP